MSNRERISANNSTIQACIDKANALPDVGGEVECKAEVEGNFEITENGEFTYTPNEGQVFSSVEVNVNVPIPDGYIQPAGTKDITENGEYNIAEFEKVNVNVEGGGGLTPSEGLTFAESYHNATWANNYGWTGFGTCTDTEIVVPSLTPEGYPVISVGIRGDGTTTWDSGVWVQGVSKIYLPDTVREVVPMGFMCGDILKYIKFGKYLRDVDSMQYSDETNPPTDVVLDLSDFALSTPPRLADTSLFTGVIEIRVPAAMVDAWKVATNWSAAADKIVGV